MAKKRLLSGLRPTGVVHIGNYFGAMKQFVDFQDEYENFVFVANLHSLTTQKDSDTLKKNTISLVKDYLAIGLDPDKTVMYLQTDVPGVTEIAWIFSTLTTMPYLMRAHAFKDAEAKNKEINVGVFNYPVLMAADILVVDADIVPVGKDQQQHVEIARDIAQKFNNTFGETFKLPKGFIPEEVAVVPGIDGNKMGKSEGNTIPLFALDEEIRGQVAKIVTDSTSVGDSIDPEKDTVFALHKLFSTSILEDLEKRYKDGSIGHKESKDILAENIIKMVKPMREKRDNISDSDVAIVLEEGAKKVRAIALDKLKIVREKTGLSYK